MEGESVDLGARRLSKKKKRRNRRTQMLEIQLLNRVQNDDKIEKKHINTKILDEI